MSLENLETHSAVTAGPSYFVELSLPLSNELERPAVVDGRPYTEPLASNELT
jgi:hypothetical protein